MVIPTLRYCRQNNYSIPLQTINRCFIADAPGTFRKVSVSRVGILGFMLVYALVGFLVALAFAAVSISSGIGLIMVKQRKGLYSKKNDKGIYIYAYRERL